MSVIYDSKIETVNSNKILYGDENEIANLAKSMIISMVEVSIDKIINDHITNISDMDSLFNLVNDDAKKMVHDSIVDLENKLMECLDVIQTNVWIKQVNYSKEGLTEDLQIDVSFDVQEVQPEPVLPLEQLTSLS